jgi:polyisoprenoid-binding protein YceI
MSKTENTTDVPIEPVGDGHEKRSVVPRWVKFTVLGLIAAVVLFYGGILVYVNFIKEDAPAAFTPSDLDTRLAEGATAEAPATATTPTTVDTATPPVASTVAQSDPVATTAAPAAVPGSGSWVATDASQVGYRVEEVLFGVNTTAVGRTNEVTGSLAVEGTTVTGVDFTVDVASITSDESRRDNQFRGRIMSADEFPTATFVLTQPIELGVEPADGVEVTTQATGDLTLRGVTNSVTFDLTAKQDNGLIGVQGGIPVVFADYGIANPSTGGISTEDDGLVEFVLVFQPA